MKAPKKKGRGNPFAGKQAPFFGKESKGEETAEGRFPKAKKKKKK